MIHLPVVSIPFRAIQFYLRVPVKECKVSVESLNIVKWSQFTIEFPQNLNVLSLDRLTSETADVVRKDIHVVVFNPLYSTYGENKC